MAGSTGKRLTGIILFILAAIGVAAFLFLLFADSESLNIPGVNDIPAVALVAAIALGVIALILVLLLIIRSLDNAEDAAGSAEVFFIPEEEDENEVQFQELLPEDDQDDVEPVEVPSDDGRLWREKVGPYDLAGVPLGSRCWGVVGAKGASRVHSFNFPREDAKALYNNDYITINANGDQLKLRTLIAARPGAYDGMKDDPLHKPKISKPAPKKAAAKPKPAPKKAKPAVKPYVDYKGDNDPVIDIEGIGPVYADKLHAIGVKTTARLCYESPESLARAIDAPAKSVRSWQTMAEFMKVSGIGGQYAEVLARAGVDGIADLKKRKADDIAAAINKFLEGLEVNVIGNTITPRRVQGWQNKAKPMRKVRQAIPEE